MVLDDLLESFRQLFFRRKWEELTEESVRKIDLFELLQRVQWMDIETRSIKELVLRSQAGRRITLKRPTGAYWPGRINVHFEHGLGCLVRPFDPTTPGSPTPTLRVGGLVFVGLPAEALAAASPPVVAGLTRLLRRGEALDADHLVLRVPNANFAFEFIERIRGVLSLADDIPVRPARDLLPVRFRQGDDDSWARCCLKALAAVRPTDPGYPALLWAFMTALPDHAASAADLHHTQAYACLHRAVDKGQHLPLALEVLAGLPPDADSATRLRAHLDIPTAVLLLSRNDGWLAAEATARLDAGFKRPPDEPLLGRVWKTAQTAEPSIRRRLLTRLAPHLSKLPAPDRPAAAEAILRHGSPELALTLNGFVVDAAVGQSGLMTARQARRLLPLLAEHPHTDAALEPTVATAVRLNDLAYALTERILAGRSLGLVPALASHAPSLPRPAADDLVDGISQQYLDGAGPVLSGFLDHPDPDIVVLAAAALGRVGGHDELMALGKRASEAGTPTGLEEALRSAMEQIEARLGPIQRGGLSMVAEGAGDLALIGHEGAVALKDDGKLSLDD